MIGLSYPRKLFNFLSNKWLLTTIILSISSNWFIFLKIFGEQTGFVLKGGGITIQGQIISGIIILISIIITGYKSLADRYNNNVKDNSQYILEHILSNINISLSSKIQHIRKYINKFRKRSISPFCEKILMPEEQIKTLLHRLQANLSQITNIRPDNISISIIYKFDVDEEWKWFANLNVTRDITLSEVTAKSNTTFRNLVDNNQSTVFYPDKRIAIKRHAYLPGPKDATFNNAGSILCHNISVDRDDKYLQAILSISTYGKPLCDINDKDAIEKIMDYFLGTYEIRFQNELLIYYLMEVLSKRCKGRNKT
jgi:hypothetical protein